MVMKCIKVLKKIVIVCLCIIMISQVPVSGKENNSKVVDIVSRTSSETFSFSKNAVAVSFGKLSDIPYEYRNVSFSILLRGTLQYDRITGKYVSASTPTATLQYLSASPLQMTNVTTSKRDNGNSVTFSFSADIYADYDPGFNVRVSYGRVSDSYTVDK